jgi:uncharacterized protein YbaR (Trm112 family)
MPIKKELLAILACPQCKSSVELYKNTWLICSSCDRKYPIKNEIPVMLIEVGDQYKNTLREQLPDFAAKRSG